jgi:hypothetical protein
MSQLCTRDVRTEALFSVPTVSLTRRAVLSFRPRVFICLAVSSCCRHFTRSTVGLYVPCWNWTAAVAIKRDEWTDIHVRFEQLAAEGTLKEASHSTATLILSADMVFAESAGRIYLLGCTAPKYSPIFVSVCTPGWACFVSSLGPQSFAVGPKTQGTPPGTIFGN